jgi:chemotaxis protein histidine kinase CheA
MGGADGERHAIRLMLVRAHGCRICVALDAVEGVFESGDGDAASALGAAGAAVPIVDWSDVTGVPGAAADDGAKQVMVLRTANGSVGLRIDSCLGVRSVSLARTPPMPTRLTDASGSPLCFLLMLDGRPHLMLEPRGLLTRVGHGAAAGTVADGAAAAAEPVVPGVIP